MAYSNKGEIYLRFVSMEMAIHVYHKKLKSKGLRNKLISNWYMVNYLSSHFVLLGFQMCTCMNNNSSSIEKVCKNIIVVQKKEVNIEIEQNLNKILVSLIFKYKF